ncbi:MAG: hypothetical protein ACIAQZ_11355 [Sedimentisphaeraceae bacterium JB056]
MRKIKLISILTLIACLVLLNSCKKNDGAGQSKPVEENKTVEQVPAKSQPEAVELEIELPKPMFVGTPQNINVPNLEKPGTKREAMLVPEGTVNLAIDKPVTSSDDEPIIGDIEMVTDGDKEAADGSYVELGPFIQYVTIDLEQECEIYAIALWHFHKQARVYNDVIVQLSNDPDFIVDPITVYNNDHDNSAGLGVGNDLSYIETYEGRLINAKGHKARYVRLYSNGNTSSELNHYIEVEVYGKPVE